MWNRLVLQSFLFNTYVSFKRKLSKGLNALQFETVREAPRFIGQSPDPIHLAALTVASAAPGCAMAAPLLLLTPAINGSVT